MKKIPTIYVRDWDGTLGPPARYVLPEEHPDCGWVFAGEGVPTRKLDGTCCLVQGGHIYRRHEVKVDKKTGALRQEPVDFMHVETDMETGAKVGWVECLPANPADKYHWLAFEGLVEMYGGEPPEGTYELIGPSINGNREKVDFTELVPHASDLLVLQDVPTVYMGLAEYLHTAAAADGAEGVVWHHEDGRMAKIKAKDMPLVKAPA